MQPKMSSLLNERYELRGVLGEGSQGVVFRAVDRFDERRSVALKVVGQGAPDALLRREFALLHGLEHPNVARVFDLGVVASVTGEPSLRAGQLYFTQELVEGESASQVIARLAPADRPAAVARIGWAAATALSALHRAGLVHRDIKPSNLLVDSRNLAVKLIDLGLAWPAGRRAEGRAGTFAYMSPDALEGWADELTDLFSLGICLAEWLGIPPSRTALPVEPPPEVPPRLWRTVTRLAVADRTQRLSSAERTADLLLAAVERREMPSFEPVEPTTASGELPLRCPILVERESLEAELARVALLALRDDPQTPRLVVLHGPSGVGKSRLLRRAVALAQSAMARGLAMAPSLVEGSLRDVLRRLAAQAPLPRPLLAWLALVPLDSDKTSNGASVLDAEIATYLAGLPQPTVVAIDDLGAAHAEQLQQHLARLSRGRRGKGLVVVLEARGAAPCLSEVGPAPARVFDVPPLSSQGQARLVELLTGERPSNEMAARLFALTGGIPLLAESVVSALARLGAGRSLHKDSLESLEALGDASEVLAYAATVVLDDEERAVAQVMALAGVPLFVDDLVAVADAETSAAAEVLARLVRRGVASRDELGRIGLPALLGGALLGRISETSAASLAGRLLSRLRGSSRADPLQLARYASLARDEDATRTFARQALAICAAATDYDAAVEATQLLAAVEEPRLQPVVQVTLARFLRLTGRYERCLSLVEQWIDEPGDVGAEACLELARCARLTGDTLLARAALERLPRDAGRAHQLEALALSLRLALDTGQTAAAVALAEGLSVEQLAEPSGEGLAVPVALTWHGQGDLDRAQAWVEAGLTLAAARSDKHLEARLQGLAGMIHHARGEFEAAQCCFRWATQLADECGDRHGGATYQVNLAGALTEAGDLEAALRAYGDGVARLSAVGRPAETLVAASNRAELLSRLGDIEAAQEACQGVLRELETAAVPLATRATVLRLCGDVLATGGDTPAAKQRLEEAVAAALEAGDDRERQAAQHLLENLDSPPPPVPARRDAGRPAATGSVIAVNRWEQLARLLRKLNSELRGGRLLELIMDMAIDICEAERGFLLVVNQRGELRVRCARNFDERVLRADDRSFSHSVALQAFEGGAPAVTTDAATDERYKDAGSVLALRLRTIAAVPLLDRGQSVGAIYVDSRRTGAFDDETVRLLEALADQAALALHNARLVSDNRRRRREVERLNEQLAARLSSSETELDRVARELSRRTDELSERYLRQGIVGSSLAMAAVYGMIDRVACSDLPVVVTGESGTGKELVARAIHYASQRARRPFVAENCAALPAALLESILFGHVRGAFTGAVRDSVGLFAAAHGGTLLLDEIGEMPLEMQTKLLRVLEDGVIRPLGGAKAREVDVRIVVATNADLRRLVEAGRFREDLFYRLNVVTIELPPLRRRSEDIPSLVRHFVAAHGVKGAAVSAEALEALCRFDWPGNVRQLRNEVQRALAVSGGRIELEHLTAELFVGNAGRADDEADLNLKERTEQLKRRLVEAALALSNGNQSQAARLLGVSRFGLAKMLTRFE